MKEEKNRPKEGKVPKSSLYTSLYVYNTILSDFYHHPTAMDVNSSCLFLCGA